MNKKKRWLDCFRKNLLRDIYRDSLFVSSCLIETSHDALFYIHCLLLEPWLDDFDGYNWSDSLMYIFGFWLIDHAYVSTQEQTLIMISGEM